MSKYNMPSLSDLLLEPDEEKFGYMLKGYNRFVGKQINECRLFPIMPYTTQTMQECDDLLAIIAHVSKGLKRELIGIQTKPFQLLYNTIQHEDIADRMYIKTVDIKKQFFTSSIQLKKMHADISQELQFELVGLTSLINNAGYIFTQHRNERSVDTYYFRVNAIRTLSDTAIVTMQHIDRWCCSSFTTFTAKKAELIKKSTLIEGVPLFVLVSWDRELSKYQTVLPFIKNTLPDYISSLG